MSTSNRQGLRRWVGDLAALAPLAVALVVLADRDGGWGRDATELLAMTAAVALPAVAGQARRWPRPAAVLLAAWSVGLVVATAFGTYRADMVQPLMQYATAPVVVLATTRLARRAWFPAVLLLLLVVTFGIHQERAWSIWWVRSGDGQGVWRPLSWHNQSAVLTGMFGVWFLGAALATSRLLRGGLVLLTATGFAGAWLSGSRAGLAATLAAAVIVAVIGWRAAARRGEASWRPALVVAVAAGLTGAIVAALLGMQSGTGVTPLAGRDQSVGHNTLARIEHAEAALGMFVDRPLTGQGPGSYDALARVWNDPSGNLTSSAHNEYAEVAGELGILGAVALLGVLGGSAVLGWRVLRDPPVPTRQEDLWSPMLIGGLGASALFLGHSAVDFDWNYPVLSTLAAIGVGLLLVWRRHTRAEAPDADARPRAPARWTADLGSAVLAIVLVGALGLALVADRADPPPWDEGSVVAIAEQHLEEGRPADALDRLAATRRWNPAGYEAAALADRARFAMDGDAQALVRATRSRPHWFAGRARAALVLAHEGHPDLAHDLVAELHEDLDRHRAWGVDGARLLAVEAEVAATVAADGCRAARDLVDRRLDAAQGDAPGDALLDTADEVLDERLATEGCGRFAEPSGAAFPTWLADRLHAGVPGLHYYTLNRSTATREIHQRLTGTSHRSV